MYDRFVFSDRQMWSCRYVSFLFFFFFNTQNALNTNYNSAHFIGVFVRIKDDNPYKIPLMMPGTQLDAQPVVLSLYRFLRLTVLHCPPHWNNSGKDPIDHVKCHYWMLCLCVFDVSVLLLVSSPSLYLETFLMHGPPLLLLFYLSGLSFPLFFGLFLCCPEKVVFEFLCSVHWRFLSSLVYFFAWYWGIYLWCDFSLGFHVPIFQRLISISARVSPGSSD